MTTNIRSIKWEKNQNQKNVIQFRNILNKFHSKKKKKNQNKTSQIDVPYMTNKKWPPP